MSDALIRLRDDLRTEHGLRWRYRQPWLLLTGDDAVISKLLPPVATKGFLITDTAVLLHGRSDPNGRSDEAWLRQLRGLRRGRPVDAVVLTIDGAAELPTPRRGTGAHGIALARIAQTLRWSAPVYALDVAGTDRVANGNTPVIGCEFSRHPDAASIEAALDTIRRTLADRSIAQLGRNPLDRYGATLSQRLDKRTTTLAHWLAGLSDRRSRQRPVSGAFFAPYPTPTGDGNQDGSRDGNRDDPSSADLPLWHHLGEAARAVGGRRTGLHPVTVFSTVALAAIGIWSAGMLLSALSNARDLHLTDEAVRTLNTAQGSTAQLRALLALQQRIDLYETRAQHHAPILTRFGLNHDRAVLAALWTPYARVARSVLVTPVQQNLEATLTDLGQMQTEQVDDQINRLALDGHKALKTYLMLADPRRADAAFMTPLLARYWNTGANTDATADPALPAGGRLDLSGRLLGFYAQHLGAHDDWRIQPRGELVNASRQTLLAVIGVKNSGDTIYQGVLESAGNRYPDQTLASLTAGTDPRGLLRATGTVAGVFTRQAYEGTIAASIDEAARRNEVATDWVLTGGQAPVAQAQGAQPPAADMKAALTARYFADYADHWQGFMNTLQWNAAPTLPAAIGQLKLMADARQSPVIALMKSVGYQGGAGAQQDSLSDTLVSKAQHVFGGRDETPQLAKPDPAGPLGASFGPVMRLVAEDGAGSGAGSARAGGAGDLSLQRFLERVTTLRLRLQQISDSPDADAQARQVAQSLFQGRGSELADTQAYAQLVAASLGAQWAGMGEALFVRPVAQATQTVLQPAQASLNDAWRQTIVATWNRSFAGRYPFAATDNDASLPELARFLRPQGGLIGAFLASQLAGVLELQGDQWVPAGTGNASLSVDPAFLKALNTLQRIAGHLLAQGEPQYRFELRAMPTPGVTDTLLTLDGQKLHYFNQQETWRPLTWPSNEVQNVGTRLQWQTEEAGTNRGFEFAGRWALVRMLERARVQPVDSATYQLTWQGTPDTKTLKAAAMAKAAGADAASRDDDDPEGVAGMLDSLTAQAPMAAAPADMVYPLSYMLRTDAGKGPLELLALRGFVLPARIFDGRGPGAATVTKKTAQSDGPPPLPKAMIDAGKRAEMPLPNGVGPL